MEQLLRYVLRQWLLIQSESFKLILVLGRLQCTTVDSQADVNSHVSMALQHPQLRGAANLSGPQAKDNKIFNEGEGKLQYAV